MGADTARKPSEGRPAWQTLVFFGMVTIFSSIILSLVGLTASYLFSGSLDPWFAAGGLAVALVIALGMVVSQYWHIRAVTPLYMLSTTLMGAMLYAMLASAGAVPLMTMLVVSNADAAAWMLLRWAFLCAVVLPVAWGLMAGRLLVLKRERVTMKGRRFRVLLVSDLHLGLLSGRRRLSAISDAVVQERPDMIVVAGDFLDTEPKYLSRFETEVSALFSSAPTYAVIGNHEFYHDLPASADWMTRMGARVLRNETVVDAGTGITVGGVDDPQAFPSADAHRTAVAEQVKRGATVVVSHQPLHFSEVSLLGNVLMLCGHTHSGQVWPMDWITKAVYKDGDRGLVSRNGSHMRVSAGAGTWGPPMRVGSLSEIVLVDVVPGE